MKNLKKSVLYVLLFSFLFLFSAADSDCESSNSEVRQSDFGLSSSFVSGTKGLSFEFSENMPPEEVFDNSRAPFSISFLVTNEGEHTIEDSEAKIAISGFNREDLDLTETYVNLNKIRGVEIRNEEVIDGAIIKSIPFTAKYTKEVPVDRYPLTIYANVCYPYVTKAFTVVCIKSDTVNIDLDDENVICELDNKNLDYVNSAAPVSIENVKQYALGENSVQLIFDIVHNKLTTSSSLFGQGSFNNYCEVSNEDKYDKENKVKYSVEHSISNSISCDGEGSSNEVILQKSSSDGVDHKTTVTCVLDTLNQEHYPIPVEITLEYEYRDRISKTISIRK